MTGSCLCGGLRYEVDGELGPIALCHCGMCRKASGTAFATNASVERTAFRLLAGTDLLQRYESSPGHWRCFCRVCGSQVLSEAADMPELVRVRLGLLDDDPGPGPPTTSPSTGRRRGGISTTSCPVSTCPDASSK